VPAFIGTAWQHSPVLELAEEEARAQTTFPVRWRAVRNGACAPYATSLLQELGDEDEDDDDENSDDEAKLAAMTELERELYLFERDERRAREREKQQAQQQARKAKEKVGVGAARNRGIRCAGGPADCASRRLRDAAAAAPI
jgi:hypothetical protein